MALEDLVPPAVGDGASAFDRFLERTVAHETGAALVPRDLLRFGLLGTAVLIVAGLLALVFPSPEAIRHGHFFLLFGGAASSLDTLMKGLAAPALVLGAALLALDAWLIRGLHAQQWRTAVVVQAATGGVGGAVSTLLLAFVILNLVLWILIGALIVGGCLLLLGALANG